MTIDFVNRPNSTFDIIIEGFERWYFNTIKIYVDGLTFAARQERTAALWWPLELGSTIFLQDSLVDTTEWERESIILSNIETDEFIKSTSPLLYLYQLQLTLYIAKISRIARKWIKNKHKAWRHKDYEPWTTLTGLCISLRKRRLHCLRKLLFSSGKCLGGRSVLCQFALRCGTYMEASASRRLVQISWGWDACYIIRMSVYSKDFTNSAPRPIEICDEM